MGHQVGRRDVLAGGMAAGALWALGVPEWTLPALAQGETIEPFLDVPATFTTAPGADVRVLDIRRVDRLLTPRDEFFAIQHYGQPEVDAASYRLKIGGLVDRPLALSMDELGRLGATEVVAGFECSGNSPGRLQGLSSNGRWTGVPLRALLSRAGLEAGADEVVFFGADRGDEDVEFRGRTFKVTQQFGRSLPVAEAMRAEVLVATALNGEPLSRAQGFPARLVVPGWYGVANVKWLTDIHVQRGKYLGKYQARWYRTLRGQDINGEVKWVETEISRLQLKSVIARVVRAGAARRVEGFVLHDGTALERVEIQVDGGPWQRATIDQSSPKYSWKRFSWTWADATPGEHTLVSRARDAAGRVQPTVAELEKKLTFLENHAQWPRRVGVRS